MLGWSIAFFIVALIASVLGFTGIIGAAASIAKMIAVAFLILFIISLVTAIIIGHQTTPPSTS